MPDKMMIYGKVVSYTQGFGDGMILLLQREPATKWESEHSDRIIIPLEVPPWTAKTLQNPHPGDWVDVEVRLMGREYKGKHYLSAQVVSVDARGAELPKESAQVVEPEPVGSPVDHDDDMPF